MVKLKRHKKLIAKQHFSFTRRIPKGKAKKNWKIIDPKFGRFRPVHHIHLPISKYG